MELYTLKRWMNDIYNPHLYEGFESKTEIEKARQTLTLSRTPNRTKVQNSKLYENIQWLVTLTQEKSPQAGIVIVYLFFPVLLKYVAKYYNKYCNKL